MGRELSWLDHSTQMNAHVEVKSEGDKVAIYYVRTPLVLSPFTRLSRNPIMGSGTVPRFDARGGIKFSPRYRFTVSPDSAAKSSRRHNASSGGQGVDVRSCAHLVMSALPPKADTSQTSRDVRFVP